MFLNLLEKEERKHFLNLARYAMSLNGEDKEEEIQVYQSFMHECELHGYQAKTSTEQIKKSIEKLSNHNQASMRAVMIEICGIVLADNDICEKERAFLNRLALAFDMETFEVRKIERWVAAMNDLVTEGYQMVGL